MKKSQKILTIISCLCLFIATFVVNVKAVNIEQENGIITNKGSIIVTGVDESDVLKAYKILDAHYSSNQISYTFTQSFANFKNSDQNYSSLTPEQYADLESDTLTQDRLDTGGKTIYEYLDTLVSKYASYVKNHNVQGFELNTNGTTARYDQAPVGAYMVIPTTSSNVYSVMVGNVELVSDNGNWSVTNANITAKVSSAIISSDNGTTDDNGNIILNGSYDGGDTITYDIDLTIPSYPLNSTNKTYTLTVDIPETIIFTGMGDVLIKTDGGNFDVDQDGAVRNNNDDIIATVVMSDAEGNPVENAADAKKLVISFHPELIEGNITVEFKGQLIEDPKVGTPSNEITVDVEYSNDPYGDQKAHEEKEIGIRTYGIKIQVTLNNGGLSGAILNVNAASPNSTIFDVYKCSNSTCSSRTDTGKSIEASPTEVGELKGLSGGYYYVSQRAALSGYKLADPVIVTLNDTTTESEDGYYVINLELEKNWFLPSTGGIGTLLFSIVGILIIGMAFYFIIDYRKKKEKNNIG